MENFINGFLNNFRLSHLHRGNYAGLFGSRQLKNKITQGNHKILRSQEVVRRRLTLQWD